MSTIESLPVASAVESVAEMSIEKPVSTTGPLDIEALIAANPAQAMIVLAEFMKKAAKAVGKQPKRKGSMPKGETPKQLNEWTDRVNSVLERMRTENPKATRKEAMAVAARELDEEDPEGAPKRAAAREKRAETAAKKKAAKAQATVLGAALSSGLASATEEKKPKKARTPKDPEAAAAKKSKKAAAKTDDETKAKAASLLAQVGLTDAAPAKKPALKKKGAAPQPETLPADTGLENVEFNGTEYFKNDSGKNTYFWEVNEDGSLGAYVGRFDEATKTLDVTYPEPAMSE
jgi:hypothetical protein